MRFGTKAIHSGQIPDISTGAIMTPIYLSSTFVQEAPGKHKGYEYSRTANPTRTALEKNLADLEDGKFGLAFSSGCAAMDAVIHLLNPGDHVLATDDLYGGTYRLFKQVYEKYGISFTQIDTTQAEQIKTDWRPQTRMLWIESPSNPLLKITDIKKAAQIAHQHKALCVVDNTFATPYLQQPLLLGADIVLHSTTKYLGGHSDIIGGAIIVNDKTLYQSLAFLQNAIGGVPSPVDAWLILRGTKTLHLRMERHCQNAKAIATFLEKHSLVKRVWYPGLKSHPQHQLAQSQMKEPGGMISFEIKSQQEKARRFVSATKIIALAESLGGVESLIEHPASMTHGSIPPEQRRKTGLSDTLIRLSVGVEDVEDLIEDLNRGFTKIA